MSSVKRSQELKDIRLARCAFPGCPENGQVRPHPRVAFVFPAPHDSSSCRLSNKARSTSKLLKRIRMAQPQRADGSMRAAFMTPKPSYPSRTRWILARRKRFWTTFWKALRQRKQPKPQYRPPFPSFIAHAHGSPSRRSHPCSNSRKPCGRCFAHSLHVRNRAVSVIARRQTLAGGFDRPAGGSFSCRGQPSEKAEDKRERERSRKWADTSLAGLHPSERCNTHSRDAHARTRAQPLHTRTTTDTHTCALGTHTGAACVGALNTHCAPATGRTYVRVRVLLRACVCGSETDRRLSAAFRFRCERERESVCVCARV